MGCPRNPRCRAPPRAVAHVGSGVTTARSGWIFWEECLMRVAILDDYQRVALDCADWDTLPDAEITVFSEHMAGVDELAVALAPSDVIVAMRERTPFTAELLGRLPVLRLLVTTGRANASIDVAAARERGVTVCGTGS